MTNINNSDAKDYIDTIRAMIRHEDILRNNRLTWMWALQGLMMTAVSILWDKSSHAVLLTGLTGIVSSLSIWASLRICNQAIEKLQGSLANEIPVEILSQHPPVIGLNAAANIILPWNLLPGFFALTWSALVIVQYYFNPV